LIKRDLAANAQGWLRMKTSQFGQIRYLCMQANAETRASRGSRQVLAAASG
jgi:hypothetical protein